MAKNPPEGMQRIIPYLYVEDVFRYVDFLTKAFGFEKRVVHDVNSDGTHVHGEVTLGDSIIMMGNANKEWGTASPRNLPAVHCGIYVYVDDVDAHCHRARAAGATIEAEPEDKFYGDRMYSARDPEGHQWYFGTHVRDVAPEEMKPPKT